MKCNGQAQFYLVHLDLMKYWVNKSTPWTDLFCSRSFWEENWNSLRMNDDPIYWGCNITNNFVPLKTSIGLLTVFIFTSRKFWSRIQFLFWILERKEKSTIFTLEIVVEDVETVTLKVYESLCDSKLNRYVFFSCGNSTMSRFLNVSKCLARYATFRWQNHLCVKYFNSYHFIQRQSGCFRAMSSPPWQSKYSYCVIYKLYLKKKMFMLLRVFRSKELMNCEVLHWIPA